MPKEKRRVRVTTSLTDAGVQVKRIQRNPQMPQARVHKAERGAATQITRQERRKRRRKAFWIAAIAHIIGLVSLWYFTNPSYPVKDVIYIELVNEILEKRTVQKRVIKQRDNKALAPPLSSNRVQMDVPIAKGLNIQGAASISPVASLTDPIDAAAPLSTTKGTEKRQGAGQHLEGIGTGAVAGQGVKRTRGGESGFDSFRKGDSTKTAPTATPSGDLTQRVDEDTLGGILEGNAQEPSGHIRVIRLKHSLSDWWQDPTAIPSFAKWLRENTQLRVDMTYEGGSLALTDDRILNAPMVIMTGHDTDIAVGRNLNKEGPLSEGFTSHERAQLRKYIIEREGMLFYDDCGFNGNLAATVANQLRLTFPEYPLKRVPHTHEIHTIYYQLPRPPRGGDVFWHNSNKGDSGGYFATESQFRFHKGITINRRLAILYNRKDYLCTMETAEVGSRAALSMRRSNDVHRFMTNLLIYQMTYGGNTDRSRFRR